MKICMITFGPVELKNNGYFIRVWNILMELTNDNNNHKVIVLEFPEVKINDRLKIINQKVTFIRLKGNEVSPSKFHTKVKNILTFDPIHNLKFQIFSFIELLKHRKLIASADVVMVEGCLIPAANIIAKLLRKNVILDTHCINKLLAKRYKNKNKMVYLLRTILWDFLERFAIKLSDIIITVSEDEREFVIKEYNASGSRVFVVPNVIEPPKKMAKEEIIKLRKKLGLEDKIIITFVGNLESVQNADAVEYILDELAPWFLKKRKDVIFLIVGKGSERFNCNLPNVIFTGFVEDLAPYLAMSDVCIAPLRVGAGTKTKVLEYMAYGKPIVTTPIGVEGLEQIITNYEPIFVTEIQQFKYTLMEVIDGKYHRYEDHYNFIQDLNKEFKKNLLKVLEVTQYESPFNRF